MVCLKQTITLQIKAVFHKFYLVHSFLNTLSQIFRDFFSENFSIRMILFRFWTITWTTNTSIMPFVGIVIWAMKMLFKFDISRKHFCCSCLSFAIAQDFYWRSQTKRSSNYVLVSRKASEPSNMSLHSSL